MSNWRDELAPIWAVLRPEYRWIALDSEEGHWVAYTHKPEPLVDRYSVPEGYAFTLFGLTMPTPDCGWQDTLTERSA